MDLFIIDNVGEQSLLDKDHYSKVNERRILKENDKKQTEIVNIHDHNDDDDEDDSDCDYGDLGPADLDLSFIELPPPKPLDPIDEEVNRFCRIMKIASSVKKTHYDAEGEEEFSVLPAISPSIDKEIKEHTKKINEDPSNLSEHNKKKLAKLERSKTKGGNWFNMPATELTDEVKRDLEVIQMRSVLDPKHFYKKNDLKALPKYFQVGKVLPSPLDYYNERGERKNKKKTIVEELMDDAQFQKFNKRKYTEVLESKRKSGYHKANQKMKKLKKNK